MRLKVFHFHAIKLNVLILGRKNIRHQCNTKNNEKEEKKRKKEKFHDSDSNPNTKWCGLSCNITGTLCAHAAHAFQQILAIYLLSDFYHRFHRILSVIY